MTTDWIPQELHHVDLEDQRLNRRFKTKKVIALGTIRTGVGECRFGFGVATAAGRRGD